MAVRTLPGKGALLTTVACNSGATIGQILVVGKVVYDLTSSKLDLGLLGLVQFLPALVLVLLAGSVADRIDRRKVVAAGATLQGLIALVLAGYIAGRPTSVVAIFALTFAFGVGQAFSAPAARSLPADMATSVELPALVARTNVAGQVGSIAGPVIGGFLFVVRPWLPFLAFAAVLAVGAVAVMFTHVRPTRAAPSLDREAIVADAVREAGIEPAVGHDPAPAATRSTVHDAMEGLRFVRTRPVILGAISLDLFAMMFGGAVALLPAIARDRLGVGAVGLGWLQGAAGLGAGVTTLVLATRPLVRRLGRILFVAVAVFGAFTVLLGVTRTYLIAFAAMFVLSGADAVSVFIRATLVPLSTPEDKRGRVLAVENVFIGASNEVGGFESGITAQLIGTSGSVVLGGLATLTIAGAWSLLFPALRRVDGFPQNPT
jgi:MFS family permease